MSESDADEPLETPREAPHEADEQARVVGRTIGGKFAIERFLGGGAMGAVYLARQIALDKNVAVKVMHARLAADKAFAARFQREAKAASRLDHANSVRIIDYGEEEDGLLYIAMEYLEGRTLFDVIHQDWPLSKERVIDIVSQALAALATAHEMGVIHRDLKPENLMILVGKDDEGELIDVVKVCDFGIAKITERPRDTVRDPVIAPKGAGGGTGGKALTTSGMVVGTPEYMSPEQAKGEALDVRSDLYSMGVILYQLLVGRVPFHADSALGIVLKHVMEEPKPPSEIYPACDRALEGVCLKAIKKNKEERYQSAREMRSDLRAALEGRATLAPVQKPSRKAIVGATVPLPASFGTAPTVAGASPAATPPRESVPLQSVPVIAAHGTSAAPPPQSQAHQTLTAATSTRPKRSEWTVPLVIIGAIVAGCVGAALGWDGILRLLAPKPTMRIVGDRTDGGLLIHNVDLTHMPLPGPPSLSISPPSIVPPSISPPALAPPPSSRLTPPPPPRDPPPPPQ
jgi:serine/threonine-protein kinase